MKFNRMNLEANTYKCVHTDSNLHLYSFAFYIYAFKRHFYICIYAFIKHFYPKQQ